MENPRYTPVYPGIQTRQAYDAAINDLTEVAEQQAGRRNKIDDLMAQAEKVRIAVRWV